MQIFNGYVIQALLTIGEQNCLPHFEEASHYIKIILAWWTIMNVKHPYKGINLSNKYATPLKVSDDKYIFLQKFCTWLDLWNNIKGYGGKLSRETFFVLKKSLPLQSLH